MRRSRPLIAALSLTALSSLSLLALSSRAATSPLAAERWRSRPVVLVAPDAADPVAAGFARDMARAQTRAAFDDRQVVVFTVLGGRGARSGAPLPAGETAALLTAVGLRADGPATMLLIGKDGGVKLRRPRLSVADIVEAIDKMPMRREEIDGN